MIVGEMLEAMSERAALPRRVLEQHHRLDARPGLEGHADRSAISRKRVVLGA